METVKAGGVVMSRSDCSRSQRLWLDKTTFQRRRYSWKRVVAAQADVPLAVS